MAIVKKSAVSTTQVNSWEKDLAEQAAQYVEQEASAAGGGSFFSTKSGQLSFGGTTMPNNEIACIILDGVLENVLYTEAYDPENPVPPCCFAFGRDEAELAPHEMSGDPQCDSCAGCEKNKWGTGVNSAGKPTRGKACRNTRRLALIIAGNFMNGQFQQVTALEHFESAKIGYLKLPVTSVKAYAGYVKAIVGAHQRPPHGMITRLKLMPDSKNQFSVIFEPLAKVPNSLMEVIMKRHKEAVDEIEFPYQPAIEESAPASKKPVTKKKY